MKRKVTMSLAAIALFAAPHATAADWFFSPDGSGSADGSSWENAASSEDLAGALADPATIAPGDNVFLQAGTYKHQNILWNITPGLNIKGGYPATMKGTDTTIEYPSAETSVFTADYDGDGLGDNGTDCFITISYDGKKEDAPKSLFAGITIRDAWSKSTGSYKGSALVVFNGNLELDHVNICNNQTGYVEETDGSLVGAGAVVSVCGGIMYAHDCVWENNKATRSGAALIIRGAEGKSGTAANELNGTNPEKSVVYLDRCEFTNNVLLVPNHAKATYGGTIAVGDYCGTLYMNNCTATGSEIAWAGAFARLGGGATMYMTNTTLFGFSCNYSARYSGTILSCGTGSKLYTANTVAVVKEDEKEGMFATMFHQGGDGGLLETGGYNVWGSLNDASNAVFAASDNIVNTNTMKVVLGSDMPEYTQHGGNETRVVSVDETYRGMPVNELKTLAAKWSFPSFIDVELDQRGLKRPEFTISGAYDPKAEVVSSVETTMSGENEKLVAACLGGGLFKVNATGTVDVMDLSGKIVLSDSVGDGIVNLSGLNEGIYILKMNSGVVKIVK